MKFEQIYLILLRIIVITNWSKYTAGYDGGRTSVDNPTYRHGTSMPTMKQLSTVADSLEKSFDKIYEEFVDLELLPKKDERVIAEDVNSKNILEDLSKKISDMFLLKEISLRKLVNKLESSSGEYEWRDEQDVENTGIIYMNETIEDKGESMPYTAPDFNFGINVNKSKVGIHIPLEVFQGYSEILNGLNWSAVVDETFKVNREEDNSLFWQYFASQTGFMRLYPSVTKWFVPPPYAHVDLFDARRRPWYISSSSLPKDVLILMDRSGSVHGQTFTIMKFAVQTLIDTLGENDYFNIAAFNETTAWVSQIISEEDIGFAPKNCSLYNESLIQATSINKRALISDIQNLPVKGIANYSDALQFGYRIFKMRSVSGKSASVCHRMMMIFSDGGTEWPEEMKKYRNDSDTWDVKIFTYALGPHPIPTTILKDLACETGGKFTVITTSSGVRTKIQDSYVRSISESSKLTENTHMRFTSTYTSAVTGNLTLSLSLPVFNTSEHLEQSNSSELLGVAGIDIPLQSFINLIPKEAVGPIGYVFIINFNGITILHPHLKSQESYLEPSPDIDILDLDLNEKEVKKVRNQMINGESGVAKFWSEILLDHFYLSPKLRVQYDFQPIPNSSYILGIFNLQSSKYLKVKSKIPVKNIDPRTSILAPWNFCGVFPASSKPDLINKRIFEDESQCDEKHINQLMWVQEWTNDLIEKWEKDGNLSADLISRTVYTRFGLGRTVSGRKLEITSTEENWRDPFKNIALKKIMLNDGLSVHPFHHSAFISKAAYMNTVPFAAVGVNVSSTLLDKKMKEALLEDMSWKSSYIMLVDDSATIVSSTQHQGSCGEFLGERWPLLLEKLVEAEIYTPRNVTDYQGYCEEGKRTKLEFSSASLVHLAIQPINFIMSIIFYSITFLEYLQCFILRCLFTSISFKDTEAFDKYEEMELCLQQRTLYHFTSRTQFSGNISCLGDSAQVLVRRTNSMNLILIAVEKSIVNLNCDGWIKMERESNFDSIDHTKARLVKIDEKSVACRNPRERKNIPGCNKVLAKACSGAKKIGVNFFCVTLMVSLWLSEYF